MWSKHENWSDCIEGMLSDFAECISISSPDNYYALGAHLLRNYMTDFNSYMLYECKQSLDSYYYAGFHGHFLEVQIILLHLSLFGIAFIKFVL